MKGKEMFGSNRNFDSTYNLVNSMLGGIGKKIPKTEQEYKDLENLVKKCVKILDEQRTGKNNNDVIRIY
jgi:hypothetical protein